MEKIAVTGPFDAQMRSYIEGMLPTGFEVEYVTRTEDFNRLQDSDYLIFRTLELRADTIKTLKKAKFIQRWGVGYDIVDIKAAGEQKIPVAVMSGINSTQVAELTIMHMLAIYRNVIAMHNGILEGKWPRNEFMSRSYTIHGKLVGVLGIGNIGRKVAQLVKPFGAEVQYFDLKRLEPEQEKEFGLRYVSLEELFKTSDIVSLHIPLSEVTTGLINKDTIDMMKSTAIIINTSRGGVINEKDLTDALLSGRILGAGLDVFENEPIPSDSPLRSLNNVVLTPHVGGNTVDNNGNMARRAIDNIVKISRGEAISKADLVNAQYL